MIKVIIFDWHGVLDKTKFFVFVERLSEVVGKDAREIYKKIMEKARVYTKGGNAEEFWRYIQETYKLNDYELEEVRGTILNVERNEELWELLPELKKKYKLALLSDCSEDKLEVIKSGVDLSMFEETLFSADEHMAKESPEFFRLILKRLRKRAEDCLYVDDGDSPIQMATKLGFKVCQFRQVADLLKVI